MKKGLTALGSNRGFAAGWVLALLGATAIGSRCAPQALQGSESRNALAWSMSLTAGGNSTSAASAKKHKRDRNTAGGGVLKPAAEIPVGPLGFAPPAPFYIGDRYAQVSLDFFNEDSLLFTFRVPGLIPRDMTRTASEADAQRQVRAVVLAIPDGNVDAEAVWTLHDHARYLWMLRGGEFVLRDGDSVEKGDATMHRKPYLRFPGAVNRIEFDPEQRWLIADTTEAAVPGQEQAANGAGVAGSAVGLPGSAAASVIPHGASAAQTDTPIGGTRDLLRILEAGTGKVRLFSQVNGVVHLPVDGEGYYEAMRGDGDKWLIEYEYFSGQMSHVGWIQSTCDPPLEVTSPGVVLASGCTGSGERRLSLLARGREKDKGRLWETTVPSNKVWPQLTHSANGLRLARTTLDVNHPVGIYSPLDADDIRGQSAQVFDLATGRLVLTVPASPVLDGGGNVALSPSGNRLAVLNAGAIQIYDLPPAPSFPGVSTGAQTTPKP